MANRGSTARVRAPLQARSRRRWLLAAGIVGLWLVFVMGSGSLVAATAPSSNSSVVAATMDPEPITKTSQSPAIPAASSHRLRLRACNGARTRAVEPR